MFLIEIAGIKILYTGDYSREEDRHLMPAERPPGTVEVMICESTFGVQSHEPRIEREARFTSVFPRRIATSRQSIDELPFSRRNRAGHRDATWPLSHPNFRSWTCAGAFAYLGRILDCASRVASDPCLLRLCARQKMHGSLPNLHQHDEHEGQEANCIGEQPFCFQAHQQFKRARCIRRFGTVRDDGQSGNAASEFRQAENDCARSFD